MLRPSVSGNSADVSTVGLDRLPDEKELDEKGWADHARSSTGGWFYMRRGDVALEPPRWERKISELTPGRIISDPSACANWAEKQETAVE
ncbi:hypothetical protein VTN49DRAFT_776 [Thermomyces lanuginosus]|uniref:uncharacterized protein n=1 Tax=Thermomyces lanuginosus TaxID=5541 RepID=UPI0037430DCA